MPRRLTLAAALLLAAALAAPPRAQAGFFLQHPPVSPAAPTSDLPVVAQADFVGCDFVPIVAVRSGSVIDLRYQDVSCPILAPHFSVPVDLGLLPAGTYTLRVVEVSDAQHPYVGDQATFTVAQNLCNAPLPTFPPPPPGLCLQGGRFRVSASFTDHDGNSGVASPVAMTAETGTFWFFGPSNRELMVKVLDGCGVNDNFWVYAAGLTDVGVVLTVTDTTFDLTRQYTRAAGGAFAPLGDTGHFPCRISAGATR
jgi:hypothetical protein